ncbi:ESX secretion-associated protein EspG [Nocardia flavorosea]|uniref:ESX secretion-associated protein EspG n=1 Tax=Nocardia flavorosea TaxID=53429 RepID=A0A846YFS8_9NOCA|nr:ESX secretion-associated protein EspG [Nocardia flavorosea]NKY55689.1 ESX secretion-associated protein EspG [Nocardia flavorosea]
MSESSWQLGGYEFTIALEAMGRDRLPYPLEYQPPRMEHEDDFQRFRQRCAQRLQPVFGEPLYQALTVLLEPEIRVEIYGVHGRQNTAIRMHAGVVGRTAVLAMQLPGPEPKSGGDIVLTRLRSNELAPRLVAGLPRAATGRHQPIRARRADLNAPVYSRHPTQLSPVEDLQRFFRRPRAGTGEITIYPGYTIDTRPTGDGYAFLWLDYPDDGRYLLHNHSTDDFTVTPGPADEILRQLRSRMETAHRVRTRTYR